MKRFKATQNKREALQGKVQGLNIREEQKSAHNISIVSVYTFRLERSQNGKNLPPIPVEMRGLRFSGFINEGDTIKLLKKWNGGMHHTRKIFNVTNNVEVRARNGHSSCIGFFLFLLIITIGVISLLNI